METNLLSCSGSDRDHVGSAILIFLNELNRSFQELLPPSFAGF